MTTIQTTTIRPGLLVRLKTSVSGNTKYIREIIEDPHMLENGNTERTRFETVRLVDDPDEAERAKKVRNKAGALIRKVCTESANFGLLCPQENVDKFNEAVAEARQLASEFNDTARVSRITVFVITGKVASDDVEAIKAINSDVRDLLADMDRGIRKFNVEEIRAAASKAKEIGAMLTDDAQARIQIAVDTARAAATEIKRGSDGERKLDTAALLKIASMRTAFLDLDDAKEIGAAKQAAPQLDLAAAE
jgi:hypothetical protein